MQQKLHLFLFVVDKLTWLILMKLKFNLFVAFIFLNSSAFLLGLLPYVRTNNLAPVIMAYLFRFVRSFRNSELRLLTVRCPRLLISCLVSNVQNYILCEQFFCFMLENSDPSSGLPLGSFRSLMFFHCASQPRPLCFHYFKCKNIENTDP